MNGPQPASQCWQGVLVIFPRSCIIAAMISSALLSGFTSVRPFTSTLQSNFLLAGSPLKRFVRAVLFLVTSVTFRNPWTITEPGQVGLASCFLLVSLLVVLGQGRELTGRHISNYQPRERDKPWNMGENYGEQSIRLDCRRNRSTR